MQKKYLKTTILIFIVSVLIITVIGGYFYVEKHKKTPQNTTAKVIEKKQNLPKPIKLNLPDDGNQYDVIVVGAEPEGVAAARSAAKNDAKVLIINKHNGPGGLMTYGMLNTIDMSKGPNGILLTQGTFKEFFKGIGSKNSFDVNKAKEVFLKLLSLPNITQSYNTVFEKPIMDGNKIIGITALKDGKQVNFYGKRIIDATQDADVAASAGVPYTVGAEDMGVKGKVQASTLVFRLKGLDWDNLIKIIKYEKKIPATYINDTSANGFLSITKKYKPSTQMLRLRGLNLGKQDDGTVLVNALLIYGVDGLNKESIDNGIKLAKKELPRIVEFFRKNIPGFEKAELDGTADELYIRETRHIKGYYTLDINDVVFNRDFYDRIAIGSYPVDVQATSPEDTGFVYGKPVEYAVPFRCIVPQNVDNLLVVGRSASYSHLAAGSARTIPIGMAEGDAAGVASAYSIAKNKSFADIIGNEKDIKNIQSILVSQGAYLTPFKVENSVEKSWANTGLKFVLHWGLIVPGYNNDFKLDENIKSISFYYMTTNMIKRSLPNKSQIVDDNYQYLKKYIADRPMNKEEAAQILLTYSGYANEINKYKGKLFELAHEKGLISDIAYNNMKSRENVKWADAYDMVLSLYNYLKNFTK
ncbi:thiamine biosynthesis Thi4 protein [Thermoanaerobacterium thermosaccharolyticum DSM 571]|uniref:Thiamine biosynthesis Thi4 protein n=1 Tax=Thermoanaerobacterium thermosaccharolyticum (strain ATCC 7956 / DSM 571 / NCIMB 9385 / NCA 3814 / NCTC 13789 / WDCM 00135 / 2032) TaxID=580327 RepID=D9TLX0_THETC|nr:FAD-dependent oxidoreductase [Thermoanaerobacterium thermosaccharolyticum]ADL69468.1 thiamine biosynthesis Thi4 protein [Thermoanaerobacterium thermosaccharolyticum DSM 571]